MPLYLIRHTEPSRNKGICYGQSDLDVAASFHDEAKAIAKILPQSFSSIYSSPLQRCYKLAETIAGASKITQLDQLMELDFGQWEMKYWGDIPRDQMDAWCIDFVNNAPPLGETFRELYDRSAYIWEHYLLKGFAGNTGVFTHAGVIRALLAHILEIPLRKVFSIQLNYGAVVRIDKVGNSEFQVSFMK